LDSGFSLVDIVLAYGLNTIVDEPFVAAEHPTVVTYFKRISSRPACVKAKLFQS